MFCARIIGKVCQIFGARARATTPRPGASEWIMAT
jgi:hypothetical protein